ncbi:MAG: polysaccharide deacetylase family protein, partial [Firmicutes bacterium]|nr:polysaccharide deacetylase family protein [Bacillota bacterium]
MAVPGSLRNLAMPFLLLAASAAPQRAAAAWEPSPGFAVASKAPIVWRGFTKERLVALTFDDGPDPRFTPEILTILHRYGAHATFFVVGRNVRRWPELLRAEIAAGHEIGNHTYDHPELHKLSRAQVDKEIESCDVLVFEVAGVVPHFFRPPYERLSLAIIQSAWAHGKQVVLAGLALEHHEARTPQEMAARVAAHVRPGTVILAHDGRLDRSATVAALPLLLSELEARGYRFVTLGELLGSKGRRKREGPPLRPPAGQELRPSIWVR